jgi:hypothetical protein
MDLFGRGYHFRPPAAAVDFSWKFEDVMAWLAKGKQEVGLYGGRRRNLGSTLTVTSFVGAGGDAIIVVKLYDLDIARIYEDCVTIGAVDSHQSQATRWWANQILESNLGYGIVGSKDRHYMWTTYQLGGRITEFAIDHARFERTAA